MKTKLIGHKVLGLRSKKPLPLLPLRNVVIFPGQVTPILIERPYSKAALVMSTQRDRRLIVCMQRDPNAVDFGEKDLHDVGTEVRVIQSLLLPHGKYRAQLEGVRRVRISNVTTRQDILLSNVVPIDKPKEDKDAITPLKRTLHEAFAKLVHLHPKLSVELLSAVRLDLTGSEFADKVVGSLRLESEHQQSFLEMDSVLERLEQALVLVSKEVELLNLEQRIQERVRKQIDQNQKQYYLNEKLSAIQKELGDSDIDPEIARWYELLEMEGLSIEVRNRVQRELQRLKKTSEMSAEGTVLRSYLDWVFNIPWNTFADLQQSLSHTRTILDGQHYGLESVKERILEQLAVQQLNPYGRMSVLCLVGPPGVGKTSLARSIAEATGRPYIRQAMGGVRDESEIRGHRRTYIGAMPGKIVQSLRRAAHMNLLICLDEIDKISSDRHHGDPAAALLEVLDPEQNHAFRDHYLDLDVDLSQVLFICTANDKNAIPEALRDRLELIELSSYTEPEKSMIASNHLIPRAYDACGILIEEVELDQSAVLSIIRNRTREAGVRELDRQITACFRKLARRKVEEELEIPFTINADNIDDLLGLPELPKRSRITTTAYGQVLGLGVSSWGGSVLNIEATVVKGSGKIRMTGRLGETLQESVHAGITFLRRTQDVLGIEENWFENLDFHVHYPGPSAHADGPSAGVAMCMAILSCLMKQSPAPSVAVTGEISIHGAVYGVGGIREKILAAHREGLETVLIPKQNIGQIESLTEDVKQNINIVCIESVDDAIEVFFKQN